MLNTNPYKPPSAFVDDPPDAMHLDVTWGRAARVWWSLMWRAILFGGLGGTTVGFVLGFFLGFAGTPPVVITTVSGWTGLIIGVPIGIWVVRNVLRTSWADFQIALIPARRG